jgi:hypothetical protein
LGVDPETTAHLRNGRADLTEYLNIALAEAERVELFLRRM